MEKKHAAISDYFVLEAGLHLNRGSKWPKKHREKGDKRLNHISDFSGSLCSRS